MIKWLLLFLFLPTLAFAQTQRNPCYYSPTNVPGSGPGGSGCVNVGTNAPMPFTGITNVPTYSGAVVALANTAAGDVYCITGSVTKTVKVKGIRLTATATSAITGDASIILRSSLDTGGGLASVTAVPMDSNNAAATAVVNSFTSAPTPGTAIGTIRTKKVAASTPANSGSTSEELFQFSVYYDQTIVLRGATQAACVNVSAFGTGASFDIDHEHTEE